jgi:hypothetical protein
MLALGKQANSCQLGIILWKSPSEVTLKTYNAAARIDIGLIAGATGRDWSPSITRLKESGQAVVGIAHSHKATRVLAKAGAGSVVADGSNFETKSEPSVHYRGTSKRFQL